MLVGERFADRVGERRRSFASMFASLLYEIYGSWILRKYSCRGTFARSEYRILFVFQCYSFNGATNAKKNLKTERVQFLSRMSKNLILFVRVDKSLPFGRANSSSEGSIKPM